MPTSASGSYSLLPLRFQNSKPGGGNQTLHTVLVDMATGIRQSRVQSGGGAPGSISVGQIASFTASVMDVIGGALVAGANVTLSFNATTKQTEITSSDGGSSGSISVGLIESFTASVQDVIGVTVVGGTGISISVNATTKAVQIINTGAGGSITTGQITSFTASVRDIVGGALVAGTNIAISFNATTKQTEITSSGAGFASFTASVQDVIGVSVIADTGVAISFNAATKLTKVGVTGDATVVDFATYAQLRSYTGSAVVARITDQYKAGIFLRTSDGVVYDDYGTRILDGLGRLWMRDFTGPVAIEWWGAIGNSATTPQSRPLSSFYASLALAQVDFPNATALTQEIDFCALQNCINQLSGGAIHMHIRLKRKAYYMGANTLTPVRPVIIEGNDAGEGDPSTFLIWSSLAVDGIRLTPTSGAGGSLFKGFTVKTNSSGGRATGGALLEYNPTDGRMIALRGTNSLNTGHVYTAMNAGSGGGGAILGTFQVTTASGAGCGETFEFDKPSTTFMLDEWIVGSTSGARQLVKYRSLRTNVVSGSGASHIVGVVGETFTGETSGNTATLLAFHSTSSLDMWPVTVLSGDIDPESIGYAEDTRISFSRQDELAYGCVFEVRAYAEDMRFQGWGRQGMVIASGADGFSGNSNLSRVNRCVFVNNGAAGLLVAGSDANVVSVHNSTFLSNFGPALVDRSFLGCQYYDNHASANLGGGYKSTNNVSRNSLFLNNYTEGTFATGCYKPQRSRIEGAAMAIGGTAGLTINQDGGDGGVVWREDDFKSRWLYRDDGITTARFIGGAASGGAAALSVEPGGIDFRTSWVTGSNGNPFRLVTKLESTMFVQTADGGPDLQVWMNDALGTYLTIGGGGSQFYAAVGVDGSGAITSVDIQAMGTDVTSTSTITINNAGSGSGAVLKPIWRRNRVVGVNIINGGTNYTSTFKRGRAFSVNYLRAMVSSRTSGVNARLEAGGPGSNHNFAIEPKGTGTIVHSGVLPHNYSSDGDAAIGGIPVGGLYHNAGVLRIRRT